MPLAMHHAALARWASVILPYTQMGRWKSVKIMQLMREEDTYGFVSVTCTQHHRRLVNSSVFSDQSRPSPPPTGEPIGREVSHDHGHRTGESEVRDSGLSHDDPVMAIIFGLRAPSP